MTRVEESKKFFNKKFYQHDFSKSNPDLSKSDFRGVTALQCNFDGCDMSNANCEGANFYGSSFVSTKLYKTNLTDTIMAETTVEPSEMFGVAVSLVCGSFEGMKVSNLAFLSFIQFALMMTPKDAELKQRLRSLLGDDVLEKIRRLCAK